MLRAAETVTRPGIGRIGDKGSVGMVFSLTSNVLVMLEFVVFVGRCVLAVVVGEKTDVVCCDAICVVGFAC